MIVVPGLQGVHRVVDDVLYKRLTVPANVAVTPGTRFPDDFAGVPAARPRRCDGQRSLSRQRGPF